MILLFFLSGCSFNKIGLHPEKFQKTKTNVVWVDSKSNPKNYTASASWKCRYVSILFANVFPSGIWISDIHV